MLVTSIFSFPHNVFYPSQNKFQIFSHFCHLQMLSIWTNLTLDLDQSKILLCGKQLKGLFRGKIWKMEAEYGGRPFWRKNSPVMEEELSLREVLLHTQYPYVFYPGLVILEFSNLLCLNHKIPVNLPKNQKSTETVKNLIPAHEINRGQPLETSQGDLGPNLLLLASILYVKAFVTTRPIPYQHLTLSV